MTLDESKIKPSLLFNIQYIFDVICESRYVVDWFIKNNAAIGKKMI